MSKDSEIQKGNFGSDLVQTDEKRVNEILRQIIKDLE